MPGIHVALQVDVHALYRRDHGWLQAWLRRKLGCSQNAADLAHDTYLRIITSGRTPPLEQSRAHLMQIAKGLVIDQYRRRRIEAAYLDALACQPEATAPSPEERALVLEVLIRIDTALGQLAPKVRETFVLSQFEGLTYSVIALQQGIAVATVRKYMLKATEACFAALGDDRCAP
ncbi:sigma-70 family RNA polymerase sigma factor [Aquabacterium sp.]|uniref:sigma-70 family RNA polymerase sigma factor n=1 Tax=Aquabacterium sp. TaxID=1872578 RepID=UPI002C46ED9F|nr:sigma-70 family RNA polymerase sigma factor [Aquabacterium sp.]HSW04724.1 sigma-70 family RNA polymerase sigma factor [Aquabacterium sp.]